MQAAEERAPALLDLAAIRADLDATGAEFIAKKGGGPGVAAGAGGPPGCCIGTCVWKTCFAISNPIVLTWPTDTSSSGQSTPPLWHADAVWGRRCACSAGGAHVAESLPGLAVEPDHLLLVDRREPRQGRSARFS
jgi:hypothetical protein